MDNQTELQRLLAQMEQQVAADAAASLARIQSGPKHRGLFIDCGSNLGQGFSYFRRFYPLENYDFILIEPNPNCIPHLETLCAGLSGNMRILAEAAGTGIGQVKFFGLTEGKADPTTQGGSTMRDHNSRYYAVNEEKAITVKTFSLADLIAESRPNYDSIILKLDIEGGEYEVLSDIVAKGRHHDLDFSYVEFHSQYMAEPQCSEYRAREATLMAQFARDSVAFRQWI